MTTTKSNLVPIIITPGVQPSTDKTALATEHYTQADKIRFRFGFPQKIGGWVSVLFNYSNTIVGIARTLFSAILTTTISTLIGTNSKLYLLINSTLINITPLVTSTTTIANSLANDYGTLGSNPIATVNGSSVITVTDSNASNYTAGDTITLSGATTTNGITNTILNTAHIVHTVGIGNYTIVTSGTANNTGSGGGASVVRATGRITATATAHGFSNGQRVKMASATAVGGITGAQINMEFVIRNVTTNTFDFMTSGTATSSVSNGGGASTTYQGEITAGAVNQSIGQGYGMGLYGIGLYGTALSSSSGIISYPQIWFMDRFGNDIIMTPGNGGGLYVWTGSSATAPTLISNAPSAVNYAFVSNNILVTFGAGGTVNRIFTSDQANMTQWTSSSSNQVFDYTVVGASQLLSHVPVANVNLIFTEHQTYLFQYTGFTAGAANAIWNIQLLENNIGIVGPMARCAVGGAAYWMDVNNFYMWAGGNVQIIPANTQEQSTIHNYVFTNINYGQSSKFFAWFNEQFDEVWFHYCSAGSNEPDRIARYNIVERHWTPDTFDRTCAEYPNMVYGYPRLISSGGTLYQHEKGVDADGSPMAWSLTTNLRGGSNITQRSYGLPSREISLLTSFIPDNIQSGNINVEIIAKRFPQSPINTYDKNYTVTPTTEYVSTEVGGRFWQYKLSGNTLGQQFIAGQWMEFVQPGSPF